MKWIVLVVMSVLSGLIGSYLGLGIQLQLNASITGNYLHNFLGNDGPTWIFTSAGMMVGSLFPWFAYWYLRKNHRIRTGHDELAALKNELGPQA